MDNTDTVLHLGPILKEVIDWAITAFGAAFSAVAVALIYKVLNYMGIQVAQAQKDQLQAIIVNGLNDAGAKADAAVLADPSLNVNMKNKVIAQAVTYTQIHGKDTIKALGLDPNSGEAVEAIKARIATAIADPATPTPAVLGGPQPLAPK
jgi:hydroxypyruvate isomerase